MEEPRLIGVLSAQQAKGKKAFSFEYDALGRRTAKIADKEIEKQTTWVE